MPSQGTPSQYYRKTIARIDLDALARNAGRIKAHCGTRLMAVVKANAYGHGALACASYLAAAGVDFLGVALAEEALELRAAGIHLPILILGRAPAEALEALLAARVTCTLTSLEDAQRINAAAQATGLPATVHIKLDTGMSRLGIQAENLADFDEALTACTALHVEGLFTHLASADSDDLQFTRQQTRRFAGAVSLLESRQSRPELVHVCASSGIHNAPEAWYDMVRAGILLYGGSHPNCNAFAVEPVMQLETAVAAIQTFAAGRSISYGNTYTLGTDRRIAVLPIGYADGLPRSLSNCGRVLLHGRLAPIRGSICMDMTMIDITDIPEAQEGSPVILFGNPSLHGESCPTMMDLAAQDGTIPYEIVCGISARVPRVSMQS